MERRAGGIPAPTRGGSSGTIEEATRPASPNLPNDPRAFAEWQAAQDQLSGALSRLLVVVEQYPDLMATQNFRELQAQRGHGEPHRRGPQIRWITLTSNGTKLDLSEVIDPLQEQVDDPPSLFFPLSDANDLLATIKPWSLGSLDAPFPDSDGVVTVRSAFGIRSDECYPFLRSAPPGGSDSTQPVIVPNVRRSKVRNEEKDADGEVVVEAVFGLGDSATCHHLGARADPRIAEGDLDGDGQPSELFGVGHANTGNAKVKDFILSALNLLGDIDGDGQVNENDLVAEAGADYTSECTGSATIVNLDASDSFTGKCGGALLPLDRPLRNRGGSHAERVASARRAQHHARAHGSDDGLHERGRHRGHLERYDAAERRRRARIHAGGDVGVGDAVRHRAPGLGPLQRRDDRGRTLAFCLPTGDDPRDGHFHRQ